LSRTNFFHLLSQEDQRSPLGKLHQKVHKVVMEVAQRKANPTRLIKLAKDR